MSPETKDAIATLAKVVDSIAEVLQITQAQVERLVDVNTALAKRLAALEARHPEPSPGGFNAN